jgi:hypothetical protein
MRPKWPSTRCRDIPLATRASVFRGASPRTTGVSDPVAPGPPAAPLPYGFPVACLLTHSRRGSSSGPSTVLNKQLPGLGRAALRDWRLKKEGEQAKSVLNEVVHSQSR